MKALSSKLALTLCAVIILTVALTGCSNAPAASPTPTGTVAPTKAPDKPADTPKPADPTADPDPSPDGPVVHSPADLPAVFFSTYYYLDGDSSSSSFYFYDDGDFDYETADDSVSGTYEISDDEITVTVDGAEMGSLAIIDLCTLSDIDSGAMYAIEDSLHTGLETYEYYYLNADEEAGSVYFTDSGDVDIEDPSGETLYGEYTIDGDTITVTYEDQTATMSVHNGYMLYSDEDNWFVRIP